MVINPFTAIGTVVKLHLWDDISLAFVPAGEIAHNMLDFATAAGRAFFDLKFFVHGHTAFLDETRK